MAERDYYDVLGVKRTASQEEIRAAYRKLARELHPDVNKAADAQGKFAEVQAAYDVLGEPEKRAQYDRFGRAGASGFPGGGNGGGAHYSWSNVGGRGGQGSADFDLDDLGSMFDAFFGGSGGGAGGGATGAARGTRAGRARAQQRAKPTAQAELDVSFMTMARGGVERVPVRRAGKATTIEVTIPKAIADGAKLRVSGKGSDPDLILTIRVGKHPLYKREDALDLALDLPLTYAEAALGGEVAVPTLEGPVYITVPPGTRSGKRLRLRGRGLTDAKGTSGDLFAEVQIVPPPAEALSEEDKAALQRMGGLGPGPRSGSPWPSQDA